MDDYEELIIKLDGWMTVQPEAAKAIRQLCARVTELESVLTYLLDVIEHYELGKYYFDLTEARTVIPKRKEEVEQLK